jgi:aconitate hydratase
VGDHNYGEGSSREHAAMEPRHLGVIAVIVKSFARIHETNLKKQGMLGLTFDNENQYDLIQEDDTFNFLDLDEFTEGKQLLLEVVHTDGSKDIVKLNHTYNQQQIDMVQSRVSIEHDPKTKRLTRFLPWKNVSLLTGFRLKHKN